MWFFIFGVLAGIALGRFYGYAKYHYPEFQMDIRLKIAEKRLRLAYLEAEEQQVKANEDEIIRERMRS